MHNALIRWIQNADPLGIPKRFRIEASGQKPVNDDWSRFAPTKAVSQYQFGLTKAPKLKLRSTMLPANLITALSMVMLLPSTLNFTSIIMILIGFLISKNT